ncbi:MAG: AI-2E family transporter [Bacteroides sp.]|nr:AI-2E family transporter [Bacteroides sp.]
MDRKKITFDSFIRTTILVAVIIGMLMLLDRLSGVLLPFFIAWLIAYMIYPFVKFFQYKLKLKSRILSIFCVLFILIGIGLSLFYLLIPPLIQEFWKVKDLLVTYLTTGLQQEVGVPVSLSEFIRENVDVEVMNRLFSQENITNTLRAVVPRIWTILAESINFLFSIIASFIILLYLVFILLDYEAIAEGWIKYLPQKYRYFTRNLVDDVQVGMNRYFRGQALVAFCVGILFCIGFFIIDFPLAIGLGIFVGILNLVPYLQIIAFAPTILLALLKAADTGQNFWIILASVTLIFIIVQIIQDSFIVPKIMGKITGLNPAIILLSLSIWGSLMGILGVIIALPLTTLLLSYYQRFIINRESLTRDVSEKPEHQSPSEKETN